MNHFIGGHMIYLATSQGEIPWLSGFLPHFCPALKRCCPPLNFQKKNKRKNNRNNSLSFKKQWSIVFCPPMKFFLAESQLLQYVFDM